MKLLTLCLTIFFTILLITAQQLDAAPVLNPDNGHYYEAIEDPSDWSIAEAAAEARTFMGTNGYLATITSEAENIFVLNELDFSDIELKLFWLGGFQPPGSPEPAGGWQWITGEAFNYTNWYPGEPNNHYHPQYGMDEGFINFYSASRYPGTWNDAPDPQEENYEDYNYIVEYGPISINIDIKPGSAPNCINNNGNGVIPVAILGSADIDVTQINVETIELEGMVVKSPGKSGKLLAHIQNVNGDEFDDLIVQIQDVEGVFDADDTTATLTCYLLNGTLLEGTDTICIVGKPSKAPSTRSELTRTWSSIKSRD